MTAYEYRVAMLQNLILAPLLREVDTYAPETIERAATVLKQRVQSSDPEGRPWGELLASHAAVALLRLLDEMSWAAAGAVTGYYPTDATRAVFQVVSGSPNAGAIRELHQTIGFQGDTAWEPPVDPENATSAGTFLTEARYLREVTSIPDVMEALRLLQFAPDEDFNNELAGVDHLIAAIEAGATSLPERELSSLDWVLIGVDLLFELSARDSPLRSSFVQSIGNTEFAAPKTLLRAVGKLEELSSVAVARFSSPGAAIARYLASPTSGASTQSVDYSDGTIISEFNIVDAEIEDGEVGPWRTT